MANKTPWLVFIALMTLACHRPFSPPPFEVKAARAAEDVGESVSVAQLRQLVEDAYRVPPDRRFLHALEEVEGVVAARPPHPVTAQWESGSWVIRRGEEELGRLPEWPTWEELWGLLARRAAEEAATVRHLPPGEAGEWNLPAEPFARTRALSQLWQRHPSRALLQEAARWAVTMAALHSDRLGTADRVSAHALALVALDEALTGERLDELSPLAVLLGYWPAGLESHAGEYAPLLAGFLRGEGQALCRRAGEKGGEFLARVLCLQVLSQLHDPHEVAARGAVWADEDPFALTYLAGMSWKSEFPGNWDLGQQHLHTAILLARGRTRPGRIPRGGPGQLARFEKALASLPWPAAAGVFPRPWAEAFLRGLFGSGVAHLRHWAIVGMGGTEARRAFADAIGPPRARWGWEVATWVNAQVAQGERSAPEEELKKALAVGDQLGGQALADCYSELYRSLPYSSLERLQWGRKVFSRLDSRPSHREQLFTLARHSIYHVELGERAARALQRSSRWLFPWPVAWLLRADGRGEELLQAFHEEGMSRWRRRAIFWELVKTAALPLESMESVYRRFLPQTDAPCEAARTMASLYVNRGQGVRAAEILEEAARMVPREGLLYAGIRAQQAVLYLHLGEVEKALATLEEVVDTYKGDVLSAYVRALTEVGRLDEALTWVRRARERYPESRGILADQLAVHWARGEWREAALAVQANPYPIPVDTWNAFVGPHFVRRFQQRPEAARQAIAAFGPRLGGEYLLGLSNAALEKEQTALALVAAEAALATQPRPDTACRVYVLKRQLEGLEPALDWLKNNLRVSPPNRISYECWEEEANEVPWLALPLEPDKEGASRVWLQRAAALARGWQASKEQLRALDRHFARPKENHGVTAVRHVLGRASAEELQFLLQLEQTPRQAGELAYYLGLAAETRGDGAEAAAWYRVAVEALPWTAYQFRWAHNQLHRWAGCERTLRRTPGCRPVAAAWSAWER